MYYVSCVIWVSLKHVEFRGEKMGHAGGGKDSRTHKCEINSGEGTYCLFSNMCTIAFPFFGLFMSLNLSADNKKFI